MNISHGVAHSIGRHLETITDSLINMEQNNVTIRLERLAYAVGYLGSYIITSSGSVISLFGDRPRILKGDVSNGYHRVTLTGFGVKRQVFCHRLVADAFIHNPINKPVVNHKDGRKSNNWDDNLEWATHSENSLHAARTGLMRPTTPMLGKFGELSVLSKKVIQYSPSGVFIKEWESACMASAALGLGQPNITAVCKGRRLSTGGFKWSYSSKLTK